MYVDSWQKKIEKYVQFTPKIKPGLTILIILRYPVIYKNYHFITYELNYSVLYMDPIDDKNMSITLSRYIVIEADDAIFEMYLVSVFYMFCQIFPYYFTI